MKRSPSQERLREPSFESHRDTRVIEEMAQTIQPLQEELAQHPLGTPERLEIWMRITQAYLQTSHYDKAVEASVQFEAELATSKQSDVLFPMRHLIGLATAFREKQ